MLPGRDGLPPGWRSHEGAGFRLFERPEFLGTGECERLIALIDSGRTPSQTFEDLSAQGHRTSETCWMNHSDPLVEDVYSSICAALNLPAATGERMQGQRYAPGQRFGPHHDFIRTDRPHWKEQSKLGGQRTWTAMIFLNAPEGGGDTHFPLAELRIQARPGTLLAWNNLDDHGQPNPASLHEGCEVTAGAKYIITQWFRERPCRTPGLRAVARRAAGRLLRTLRRT